MSSVTESRQAKIISELRTFIKKALSEPDMTNKCMAIARQYKDHPDGDRKIADEISRNTTVRIPEVHSDADELFLEIIREVLDDEAALY